MRLQVVLVGALTLGVALPQGVHGAAEHLLPRKGQTTQARPLRPLPVQHAALGLSQRSVDGRYRLTLAARLHGFPGHAPTLGRYDPDVRSPKSVAFSRDGSKVFINAMRSFATLVYDAHSLVKLERVQHRFTSEHRELFMDEDLFGQAFHHTRGRRRRNVFSAKPVEFALSGAGDFLFMSYYRRGYDRQGRGPSAFGVLEVQDNELVRVVGCGPVPKSMAVSADGSVLAVVHWGDNSVGLYDVGQGAPAAIKPRALVRVGHQRVRLPAVDVDVDRDKVCGRCLRGAVFSPDGRYLVVGETAARGLAVIDVAAARHLGSIQDLPGGPRHLVLTDGGAAVLVGMIDSGAIHKYQLSDLVAAARAGNTHVPPRRRGAVGRGTRTMATSPDGTLLFLASNRTAQLALMRTDDLETVATIAADPFPVGLAVAPDGKSVWLTSQGKHARGGNTVQIFRVDVPAPSSAVSMDVH